MSQLPNRPIIQKREHHRSRAYINNVKSLPCIFPGCGLIPCGSAHHLKGVGHASGGSLTAPDYWAMPLCLERGHHMLVQRTPEYWPMQWEWICRTLGRAIDEGIIRL